ncbi:MAG: DUF5665 domain-containing protein [Candidatus Dojkabacteria bacterium]
MPEKDEELDFNEETLKLLRSIDRKLNRLNSLSFPKELIRGLMNGFGFVLGTTVLVAISILILRQFITIPVIGQFVGEIINVVERK